MGQKSAQSRCVSSHPEAWPPTVPWTLNLIKGLQKKKKSPWGNSLMVWVKLPWVSGTPECIFLEAEGSETCAEKGQPPVRLSIVLRHIHTGGLAWPVAVWGKGDEIGRCCLTPRSSLLCSGPRWDERQQRSY